MKTDLPNLKIYKDKSKEGVVERATNEYEVIVKDLVKKETNLDLFVNLKVKCFFCTKKDLIKTS